MIKPADGERIARIGYEAQDKRAANLIYDTLVQGLLDWIRIADPEAGRVDDIQVATVDGDLHAYQVKWAETTQYISFADFTRTGDDPSLIAQLADGWQRLKKIHGDRQIFVHLIHRHIPSPKSPSHEKNIKLPLDNPPPLESHFQSFVMDCFQNKNWLSSGLIGIPSGWRAAIDSIRHATGLFDDKEFLDFMSATFLHFNYQFPEPEAPKTFNAIRREKDVDHLARLIAKLGGGEKRVIEINRDELLRQLGWSSRFEFRFKHEFAVDEKLYQPITQTVEELNTAIDQFSSGYIALIGTPGSGKSTTLTQTVRYRKGLRVIRYYAYVPDSSWQEARGEASSFLHDLYLALQRQGVYARTGKSSQPESLNELREALKAQFHELHEQWRIEQILTLIIVDGLDHIEREQSPDRSLLKELPVPSDIPDGVLLVLGSQTLSLTDLPPRIVHHLREAGRTLTIHALPRSAVFEIIKASVSSVALSSTQQETVYTLSGGHPLALCYLLANLRNAIDEDAVDQILNSSEPYQKHIEENYHIYWEKLSQHSDLKEFLALLSRLRGIFNPEQILNWTNDSTIQLFLKYARHYFREETETRWNFFHNSFRQFILFQTRRNILGKPDELLDKNYHQKLADYSSKAIANTSWAWEALYHHYSAENLEQVLNIGTQEYFRQQFFNLRPLEAILEDIAFCLKAASFRRDGVAIIRMFLIEKELNDRQQVMDSSALDLPKLLYELKGLDSAMQFVMDGQQLRVSRQEALQFTALLASKGELKAAEKLFNISEPLAVLSGAEAAESHSGNLDTVYAWINIAPIFRPFEKIITVIDQLRADTTQDWKKNNSEHLHQKIRRNVLSAFINAVCCNSDICKIEELASLLKQCPDGNRWLQKLYVSECTYRIHYQRSEEALTKLLEWSKRESIGDHKKLQLADFAFRIWGDKSVASNWIFGISQPELYEIESEHGSWNNLTPFLFRIRLNRLLSMLGKAVEPTKAVPTDEPRRQGGVLFERNLVIISNLWGQAWANKHLSGKLIVSELRPAFTLFSRTYKETDSWTCWYSYRKTACDFYNFMIHAVSTHGTEALQAVGAEFDSRWEAEPHYWPTDWQRKISVVLYQQGGSKQELITRLHKIETRLNSDRDSVLSRISELSEQTLAWLEIEQKEYALNLFPQLFQDSFGVWHDKDYQFSDWVKWLAKITAEFPDMAGEEIRRFSSALVVLEESNSGRGTQSAATELITLTATWNPEYSLNLKDWLLANYAIHYANVLDGILTAAVLCPDVPIEWVITLTGHLLIPFAESVPEYLPKLLAEKTAQQCSQIESSRLLEWLEKVIDTKAFPSNRAEWWSGIIEGLQSAGVNAERFYAKYQRDHKERYSGSNADIVLITGEKLSREDALLKIDTPEKLLDFIDLVEKAEYFAWYKVVAKIAEQLSYEHIQLLLQKLSRFSSRVGLDALFAERLKVLGHIEEGRKLLQPLFDESLPQGWSKRFDGGSRLFAMQALVKFDSEVGRHIVYENLVRDYLSGRFPSSVLDNLESLIPLLFEQIPLATIWQEIREHVYRLNEFSHDSDLLPPVENSEKPWLSVLLRLLRDTAKLEVEEIREETHRALCKLCLNASYDSETTGVLQEMLNSDETEIYQALAVLESIQEARKEKVLALTDVIYSRCDSSNMSIRNMALGLLEFIGKTAKMPEYKALPTIYSLQLPKFVSHEEVVPFEALPPGSSFPDTSDPLEMIRPFEPEFKLLSKASGIPLQNLVNRAALLMRSLKPYDLWNRQAEEKMKSWLNAAELKFAYHRLRPQQALCALNHIATELADADMFDTTALDFINYWLIRHDDILSLLEPTLRPKEIRFPESQWSSIDRDKDWLEKSDEAFSLMPERLQDGRTVLAELTKIRDLGWETPTEYRFNIVAHPNYSIPSDCYYVTSFFPHEFSWYAMAYPFLKGTEIPATVIYGKPRSIEPGSQGWLAFNPMLALELGWELSSSGLFRWINDRGQIMVESIYWQDGPIDRLPPRSDVCGEGWLVVAEEEAFNILMQSVKQAARHCVAVRKYKSERRCSQISRQIYC